MNPLHTAYATQYDGGPEGKSEWHIYSKDKEVLAKFPGHYTEQEIMNVIKFGREFEVKAFNEGINFQKAKQSQETTILQRLTKDQNERIDLIIAENVKLSNELDKLMFKN